jgi:hypothetical protein
MAPTYINNIIIGTKILPIYDSTRNRSRNDNIRNNTEKIGLLQLIHKTKQTNIFNNKNKIQTSYILVLYYIVFIKTVLLFK